MENDEGLNIKDNDTEEPRDEQEQEKPHIVNLTRNEAFFIYDKLTMLVVVTSEDPDGSTRNQATLVEPSSKEGIGVPQSLIETIGFCLLDFADREVESSNEQSALADIPVELREMDLIALREIVQSRAVSSGEKVGESLTMKIARALFGVKHHERAVSNRLLNEVYPEETSNMDCKDLTSVNARIVTLIDKLGELNGSRDAIIQQVERLNEVALDLKGIRLESLEREVLDPG